jgi:hypothetical protein
MSIVIKGLLCHAMVQNLGLDSTNEYMTIFEEEDAV